MKKNLLCIAFICSCLSVQAQKNVEVASSNKGKVFYETASAGGHYKNMSPLSLQWKLGYMFTNRFYATANLEYLLGRYKSSELKTYYDSANLGVGVGYNLVRTNNEWLDPCKNIDLRLGAGTTIGHTNWKYTFYEAGIMLDTGRKNSLILGAGYRYMDSHTETIDDYKGFYVSLGLRI